MPKAFPEEFRRDVVAVALRKQAPMRQIAKDFGIGELPSNWSARWSAQVSRLVGLR